MSTARNQELDLPVIKDLQAAVRMTGGYPGALLLTDGYTFWVESWKPGIYASAPQIISLRSQTPLEAWMSARDYLAAR